MFFFRTFRDVTVIMINMHIVNVRDVQYIHLISFWFFNVSKIKENSLILIPEELSNQNEYKLTLVNLNEC